MSAAVTGGPAFPPYFDPDTHASGMTLRDHYVGLLMQGFCANPAVFAANSMSGWALVNSTEYQLINYAQSIADKIIVMRGLADEPEEDGSGS
ncbi:MAG: hypothetical protein JWP38_3683 [Herbaspirillum sp.]|nr:hypothetical protein [Herbaspirillum sp.]